MRSKEESVIDELARDLTAATCTVPESVLWEVIKKHPDNALMKACWLAQYCKELTSKGGEI